MVTKRQAVIIPAPAKIDLKWLWTSLIVLCLIGGIIGGYFAFSGKVAPTTNIPASVQEPVPPVSTLAESPSDETPEQKIFFPSEMGLFLLSGDNPSSYSIGYEASGTRIYGYPEFEFPILVSEYSTGKVDKVFGTIADPGLEIGQSWESTFVDPDHPKCIMKVGLVRVAEDYKYNVISSLSTDAGESFPVSVTYPFELMLE